MSAFEDKLRGNWNQIKGKAKEQWGSLTDDDLTWAEGKWDQVVGNIQRKTGEAKEDIQRFFDRAGNEFDDTNDDTRREM